jgi:hypothetical protein
MTNNLHRFGFALNFACSILGAATAVAGEQAPAPPVEYSVLTPALEAKYSVSLVHDLFLGGEAALSDVSRSKRLREAVLNDHYQASRNLQSRLTEALTAAGMPAASEEVSRGPDGTVSALSRSELPAQPKGHYLVNVAIVFIGLAARSEVSSWEPNIQLRWMVLGSDGSVLTTPRYYGRGPSGVGWHKQQKTTHHTKDCGLPATFDGVMEDPSQIWACFDRAFRDAGADLATEIRETQERGL